MKNILTQDEVDHIRKVCATYRIDNYSINPDGSIDVDEQIIMRGYGRTEITRLPIRFNKVNGMFSVQDLGLTTLEGCPKYVRGSFDCSGNNLTSLVGSPTFYGGSFVCSNNKISTLDGCPEMLRSGINYLFNDNNFPQVVYDKLLGIEENQENINTFLKYYKQCDIWNPEFNEDNFNDLMDEILDGLK